ncbi:hypothetical protein GCM10010522_31580 [Kribbella solani]|uniref:SRSO17 transposase n=1 Tax=Kribbella solani TaxID=236067 RepID=A0A841DPR2_9ACTN|nr:SRSO17 transposase [Kribbella solani]
MARIAPRFARLESRRLERDAVAGLMSGLAVKTRWTVAEHVGHDSPDGLQHLLRKAKWIPMVVRDDLRRYVVERFGQTDAVLVVDETGDLKKGAHTAGGAAPIRRDRWTDRERPGSGLPDLCQR